jgi:alkanesulfonate monooxygenase SsuD/methylene tetrahydromethanopterin reductase-like flavin-dependent oxidoreductase (luciferase family)
VSLKIGIGLPNPIPGTPGERLLEWARRSEEAGFSSLATIDRIAYPSYESLVTLAAAAGATSRIGLLTNVLLGPTRNPVLLAKEAASVDQLSGGRLTLGLAVGGRKDDFDAVELSFSDRGKRWDRSLEIVHRVWKGELVNGALVPIGPTPIRSEGVPILIGGRSDATIERVVKWGVGYTVGGAPPEVGGPFAERVRAAWARAGRAGAPRIVGLTYFVLGDRGMSEGAGYLDDYYGEYGSSVWERTPKSGEALRGVRGRFEDFGFDELFVVPVSADLAELDLAAEAVL